MTDPPPPSSSSFSPTPTASEPQEVPPLRQPGLRTSQSFRFDEGYSGEETPGFYEDPERFMRDRDRGEQVRIPAWMTGLNDALREEYAYKLVRTLPTSHIASLVDRLVPILHLDFVQILPSELSLQILSYLPPKALLRASLASRTWRKFALEPKLWKDLYHDEGWEANLEEVRKFEQDMRERAEEEMRQQTAARRKADELAGEAKRRRAETQSSDERMRSNSRSASIALSNEMQMETTRDEEGDVEIANSGTSAERPSSSIVSMSDEEDMYPTPLRAITAPAYIETPLPIEPGLTTPGYGSYGPPRLNWAFLFKNRQRLEENWQENRFANFEIPHPNYPHEGHNECIYTLQYSPKWLVSGSRDKSIRVWDVKTRRLRSGPGKGPGVLVGHTGSVLCLQFDESPEEDVIISGSSDSNVIVWKFSTGEILKVIENAHAESVLNLRFNKKWLITCSKDKLIKIWNRQPLDTANPDYPWYSKTIFGSQGAPLNHPNHPNYTPAWTVQHPASTSGLGLHNPFGSTAFKAPYAPTKALPQVKNLPAYTTCQALEGHIAAVNAIQLQGNEIVSASGDRSIKLWNLRTGQCEKTFVGHRKGIACIQYDGHNIVSGSSDQTIRVFDKHTQAEIATLQGHEALVRTVQASRDKIVSGSYDESVRIWRRDPETGEWATGPTLRQFERRFGGAAGGGGGGGNAGAHTHGALQMQAMQQFQAMHPHPQGLVHTHAVHAVGPGLAGAVVAAQLLPANHHAHAQQVHAQVVHAPAAAAAPPAVHAPGAPPAPNTVHRVFKLQFDARWIICSQDSRIVGWDYAYDDDAIIEASRFFKGGSEAGPGEL